MPTRVWTSNLQQKFDQMSKKYFSNPLEEPKACTLEAVSIATYQFKFQTMDDSISPTQEAVFGSP
jgi:hypothetical protein